MKILIVSFISLIVLASCADLNRKEQLKKVEQLSFRLDSLEVIIKEARIDTLSQIEDDLMSLEKRIRENYTADTIDASLVIKMEKYRQLKKYFLPERESGEDHEESMKQLAIGSAYAFVQESILAEKAALSNLKNDITNGFGMRDKYNEYIAFETGKINQLKVISREYCSHKDKVLNQLKSVYGALNTYASNLEREKKLMLTH